VRRLLVERADYVQRSQFFYLIPRHNKNIFDNMQYAIKPANGCHKKTLQN
jgi:hypothetical protein